jgi:tRNA threonylcarbamoyladenosine biosynthesis protein TsaE
MAPAMINGPPVHVPDAESMRALGRRIARMLRAGDLVLLGGELGAGKTTLAQGIGAGLGVRGRVTSPTFVITRVHQPLNDGPPLVHVDAYRLRNWDEVEDLDLEATLDEAVTIVEWGEGLAEGLGPDRLEVHIHRPTGKARAECSAAIEPVAEEADVREVTMTGVGARWKGVDVASL